LIFIKPFVIITNKKLFNSIPKYISIVPWYTWKVVKY